MQVSQTALRLFSLIYFLTLLFMSAFVTYHGSYSEYLQNSTQVIQEEADAEDMMPTIALCRIPGDTIRIISAN